MIEGTLDAVVGGTLRGWAWDASRPDDAVVVEVFDDARHTVLGSVTAAMPRSDLRAAGKGNGRHGFSLGLAALASENRTVISARVAGTDFVLAGSPLAVEIDDEVRAKAAARAARIAGRFCRMPFEKLVLQDDGARLCCPSYLPTVVGDPNTQTLEEIWNSETAVEIRRSIVDGDFQHCLDLCPEIGQGTLPRVSEVPRDVYRAAVAAKSGPLEWGPKRLALLHDRTCNLSCPSCRTTVVSASRERRKELDAILERVVRPALGSLEVLELGGGEVFASAHLRGVVDSIDRQRTPGLRVAIMTNGTLFDGHAWDALRNVHGMIQQVYVSLDAASKETFEELRRGGAWEKTLANVERLAGLRRCGEIEELAILFVVQVRNFHEMRDFVRLGKRLACDRILFHELVDFGTYAAEGFAERHVAAPSHPRHAELVAELDDAVFDDPHVDLTNLASLRRRPRAAAHAS